MPKDKLDKIKLPNEIIVIPNKDKNFHEKWYPTRNLMNIPHPFRCCALGPPNSGKSNMVKNLILRQKPIFKEIFIIHCDSEYTKEYEDLDATFLEEFPAPSEWEGEVKTLVIIDDVDLSQLPKDQKKNLDRLGGFVSTHKNISVILTAQDAFQVPTSMRRMSNLFILWRQHDIDSLGNLARKTGLKGAELLQLFDTFCANQHDSIMIDLSPNSPAKLRLNGFKVLEETM